MRRYFCGDIFCGDIFAEMYFAEICFAEIYFSDTHGDQFAKIKLRNLLIFKSAKKNLWPGAGMTLQPKAPNFFAGSFWEGRGVVGAYIWGWGEY